MAPYDFKPAYLHQSETADPLLGTFAIAVNATCNTAFDGPENERWGVLAPMLDQVLGKFTLDAPATAAVDDTRANIQASLGDYHATQEAIGSFLRVIGRAIRKPIGQIGEERRESLSAATARTPAPNPAMAGFSVGQALRDIECEKGEG